MNSTSSIEGILDASVPTSAQAVLASLTSADVKVVDAIIGRASSATTFLTIFKAYNEVLAELKLNAEEDVVYYKFLLKLGVIKGLTWGDKWESAKAHHGYHEGSTTHSFAKNSCSSSFTSPRRRSKSILAEEDGTYKETRNCTGLSVECWRPLAVSATPTPTSAPPSDILTSRRIPFRLSKMKTHTNFSSEPSTSSTLIQSPFQPVQPKSIFSSRLPPRKEPLNKETPSPLSRPPRSKLNARVADDDQPEGDDAWEKLRLARHERIADDFRIRTLLLKCFDVWRRAAQWVYETTLQVSKARNKIRKALFLSQWRVALLAKKDQLFQADQLASASRLRHTLKVWFHKAHKASLARKRNALCKVMKQLQRSQNLKLRKDAWAKWRQNYESKLAEDKYHQKLATRTFMTWNMRLNRIQHLLARSDEIHLVREGRSVERIFFFWRGRTGLSSALRAIQGSVARNLASRALKCWRNRASIIITVHNFDNRRLMKAGLYCWKSNFAFNESNKHLALQYEISLSQRLLRRTLRTWIAKERGELWRRVRTTGMMRCAWQIWNSRSLKLADKQNAALTFSKRIDYSLAFAAMKKWTRSREMHMQLYLHADDFVAAHILERALYQWRIHLRYLVKFLHQSKVVRRFFLERRAWAVWKHAIKNKKLEHRVQAFGTRRVKCNFVVWRKRTYLRKLEMLIVKKRHKLVLNFCLQHWTKRVIDIKWVEFSTVEGQRQRELRKRFVLWRSFLHQAQENMSLMESFRAICEEDLKRRVFTAWLMASRRCKRRRLRLEAHQTETNQAIIMAAWEQWRGKLTEERLRVPESEMRRRLVMNLTFRVFITWQSKTRILPAIQMRTQNLRRMTWMHWRGLMPKVIRHRQAREFLRHNVLRHSLGCWVEAWRAKSEMRNMARARYLRLSRQRQVDKQGLSGLCGDRDTSAIGSGYLLRADSRPGFEGRLRRTAKGTMLPTPGSLTRDVPRSISRPRSLATSEEKKLFRWRRT